MRHTCCNKATTFIRGRWDKWYLDDDQDWRNVRTLCEVTFCPFCGERLPTEPKSPCQHDMQPYLGNEAVQICSKCNALSIGGVKSHPSMTPDGIELIIGAAGSSQILKRAPTTIVRVCPAILAKSVGRFSPSWR